MHSPILHIVQIYFVQWLSILVLHSAHWHYFPTAILFQLLFWSVSRSSSPLFWIKSLSCSALQLWSHSLPQSLLFPWFPLTALVSLVIFITALTLTLWRIWWEGFYQQFCYLLSNCSWRHHLDIFNKVSVIKNRVPKILHSTPTHPPTLHSTYTYWPTVVTIGTTPIF